MNEFNQCYASLHGTGLLSCPTISRSSDKGAITSVSRVGVGRYRLRLPHAPRPPHVQLGHKGKRRLQMFVEAYFDDGMTIEVWTADNQFTDLAVGDTLEVVYMVAAPRADEAAALSLQAQMNANAIAEQQQRIARSLHDRGVYQAPPPAPPAPIDPLDVKYDGTSLALLLHEDALARDETHRDHLIGIGARCTFTHAQRAAVSAHWSAQLRARILDGEARDKARQVSVVVDGEVE